MPIYDVCIIGAGAAGLFCAGVAGQRGLNVLVIDHSAKVAEKIRISGGGRCNFTNRELDPATPHKYFLSENPHFCRSALARYTPQDFIALMDKHGVAWHEKHKGQLFCDHSAGDLIAALLAECDAAVAHGGLVTRWQPCSVKKVQFIEKTPECQRLQALYSYEIESDRGVVSANAVVIATGGLSIPKIGATDFGYQIAQQFGLRLVATRAALVPLTFGGEQWKPYAELAGLALPVVVSCGSKKQKMAFSEDLLFTHRGLSGPGILQISSYWTHPSTLGTPLQLNLAPLVPVAATLMQAKARGSRKKVANELASIVPTRLADAWISASEKSGNVLDKPIADIPDKALAALAAALENWHITPSGTEGYAKAEVTAGGVDTRDLSSQTMESKHQPGLYFIGEVVDVTGWLGGYNFQWAWASGFACGQALGTQMKSPSGEIEMN